MKPEPSCRTFAAAVVLAAGLSMSVGCGRVWAPTGAAEWVADWHGDRYNVASPATE